MSTEEERLAFIVHAKERYRADARSLSYEEKIESVELMQEAARTAREAMKAALAKKQTKTDQGHD